jgi:hypothetical protein
VGEIFDNQKWFKGPSFLWAKKITVVNESRTQLKEGDVEVKTNGTSSSFLSNVVKPQNEKQPTNVIPHQRPCELDLKYFDRFSLWYQAKRWLSQIKRGVHSLEQRKNQRLKQPAADKSLNCTLQENTRTTAPDVDELSQSEIIIL